MFLLLLLPFSHLASAVVLQSERAGSHPLFIVFQIHSSYSIIHPWFWSCVFLWWPLFAFKANALSRPQPSPRPLSVHPSVSVLCFHHPSSPCIIDLTSLCLDRPSVPADPASRTMLFSPYRFWHLGNDTPQSETAAGQPLVVHLQHFSSRLFPPSNIKYSSEELTDVSNPTSKCRNFTGRWAVFTHFKVYLQQSRPVTCPKKKKSIRSLFLAPRGSKFLTDQLWSTVICFNLEEYSHETDFYIQV